MLADVRKEESQSDEDGDAVDVHGKLDGVEGVPRQDSEESIQAGGFVDEEGDGNNLGAGLQGHEA